MHVCVAHSEDPSTFDAAPELIEQIKNDMGSEKPVAALLFASMNHDHEQLLTIINDAFPDIQLIGCTTDGEVSSRLQFCEDSTTLVVFGGSQISFASGVGRNLSQDPVQACRKAVTMARTTLDADGSLCLVAAESLTTSGDQIVASLKGELGPKFPIVGGVAGSGWSFDSTKQFHGREVLQDSVPILLIGGAIQFSVSHASGWQPLPLTSTVTKSVGNLVHHIDGQPALDFYHHYLGDSIDKKVTPESPLAILSKDRYYLRAPYGYDANTGSVTFSGDVPKGCTVAMTKTMRTTIVDASADSMSAAFAAYPGTQPLVALFVSCAARKQILGTKTFLEYQALTKQIPANLPVCGFYSYGEIAPISSHEESAFHNQTCVSVVIGT